MDKECLGSIVLSTLKYCDYVRLLKMMLVSDSFRRICMRTQKLNTRTLNIIKKISITDHEDQFISNFEKFTEWIIKLPVDYQLNQTEYVEQECQYLNSLSIQTNLDQFQYLMNEKLLLVINSKDFNLKSLNVKFLDIQKQNVSLSNLVEQFHVDEYTSDCEDNSENEDKPNNKRKQTIFSLDRLTTNVSIDRFFNTQLKNMTNLKNLILQINNDNQRLVGFPEMQQLQKFHLKKIIISPIEIQEILSKCTQLQEFIINCNQIENQKNILQHNLKNLKNIQDKNQNLKIFELNIQQQCQVGFIIFILLHCVALEIFCFNGDFQKFAPDEMDFNQIFKAIGDVQRKKVIDTFQKIDYKNHQQTKSFQKNSFSFKPYNDEQLQSMFLSNNTTEELKQKFSCSDIDKDQLVLNIPTTNHQKKQFDLNQFNEDFMKNKIQDVKQDLFSSPKGNKLPTINFDIQNDESSIDSVSYNRQAYNHQNLFTPKIKQNRIFNGQNQVFINNKNINKFYEVESSEESNDKHVLSCDESEEESDNVGFSQQDVDQEEYNMEILKNKKLEQQHVMTNNQRSRTTSMKQEQKGQAFRRQNSFLANTYESKTIANLENYKMSDNVQLNAADIYTQQNQNDQQENAANLDDEENFTDVFNDIGTVGMQTIDQNNRFFNQMQQKKNQRTKATNLFSKTLDVSESQKQDDISSLTKKSNNMVISHQKQQQTIEDLQQQKYQEFQASLQQLNYKQDANLKNHERKHSIGKQSSTKSIDNIKQETSNPNQIIVDENIVYEDQSSQYKNTSMTKQSDQDNKSQNQVNELKAQVNHKLLKQCEQEKQYDIQVKEMIETIQQVQTIRKCRSEAILTKTKQTNLLTKDQLKIKQVYTNVYQASEFTRLISSKMSGFYHDEDEQEMYQILNELVNQNIVEREDANKMTFRALSKKYYQNNINYFIFIPTNETECRVNQDFKINQFGKLLEDQDNLQYFTKDLNVYQFQENQKDDYFNRSVTQNITEVESLFNKKTHLSNPISHQTSVTQTQTQLPQINSTTNYLIGNVINLKDCQFEANQKKQPDDLQISEQMCSNQNLIIPSLISLCLCKTLKQLDSSNLILSSYDLEIIFELDLIELKCQSLQYLQECKQINKSLKVLSLTNAGLLDIYHLSQKLPMLQFLNINQVIFNGSISLYEENIQFNLVSLEVTNSIHLPKNSLGCVIHSCQQTLEYLYLDNTHLPNFKNSFIQLKNLKQIICNNIYTANAKHHHSFYPLSPTYLEFLYMISQTQIQNLYKACFSPNSFKYHHITKTDDQLLEQQFQLLNNDFHANSQIVEIQAENQECYELLRQKLDKLRFTVTF